MFTGNANTYSLILIFIKIASNKVRGCFLKDKKRVLIKKLINFTILHIPSIEKIIASFVYERIGESSNEIPIFKIIDLVFKRFSDWELLDTTVKKYDEKFTYKEIKELIKIYSSPTYKKYYDNSKINDDIFKTIFEIAEEEMEKFMKK